MPLFHYLSIHVRSQCQTLEDLWSLAHIIFELQKYCEFCCHMLILLVLYVFVKSQQLQISFISLCCTCVVVDEFDSLDVLNNANHCVEDFCSRVFNGDHQLPC